MPAKLRQVFITCFALGQTNLGKVQTSKLQVQITQPSDAPGILQGLWDIREKLLHLLRAPEIEGISCHLQPPFVMNRGIRLYAEEQVLPAGILPVYIVDIISSHHRYIQFRSNGEEPLVDLLYLRDRMPLDLQIVVTKKFLVPQRTFLCLLAPAFQNEAGYLPAKTA